MQTAYWPRSNPWTKHLLWPYVASQGSHEIGRHLKLGDKQPDGGLAGQHSSGGVHFAGLFHILQTTQYSDTQTGKKKKADCWLGCLGVGAFTKWKKYGWEDGQSTWFNNFQKVDLVDLDNRPPVVIINIWLIFNQSYEGILTVITKK